MIFIYCILLIIILYVYNQLFSQFVVDTRSFNSNVDRKYERRKTFDFFFAVDDARDVMNSTDLKEKNITFTNYFLMMTRCKITKCRVITLNLRRNRIFFYSSSIYVSLREKENNVITDGRCARTDELQWTASS